MEGWKCQKEVKEVIKILGIIMKTMEIIEMKEAAEIMKTVEKMRMTEIMTKAEKVRIIEKVEFVSKSCYHATLTDDNVNRIERQEGQLLSFFSFRELQNLLLSNPTREFVSKHGALI